MFDYRTAFGIQYQNIFNRVQVRGPVDPGAPLKWGQENRIGKPFHSYVLGLIGAAQVGPFYLGTCGLMSIVCGFIAFEIIGLNMLASVNWDPVQFIRLLPWLGLEPPAPSWGLRIPPLAPRRLASARMSPGPSPQPFGFISSAAFSGRC
jgi:photosynthetic reaction center M subunit